MGAGSLYVVSSTIIQMVTRGFASREFAGRSSFGIKFTNSSDAMPAWSVHRLFFSSRLSNLCWSHISTPLCSKLLELWRWSFLFTFQSCWIITHILTAFSITVFTQFVKKKKKLAVYSLVCLVRSLLLTKWTEYRKNRCLNSSTNRVRLNFRERVEKTKIWREKIRVRTHLGKNLKNYIISWKLSLKLLWTVI